MTKNEQELIDIIRTSEDPQRVAQYMLSLFLGYLQTHAPDQEIPVAIQEESA